MNKSLLIKHIKGETSQAESAQVIAWIDKSKENEAYYLELMNTVIAEDALRERTSIKLSPNELKESYGIIINKLHKNRQEVFTKSSSAGEIAGNGNFRKIQWLTWLSACAVVLLFISVSINFVQYFKGDKLSGRVFEKQNIVIANNEQTYYTENGVKGKIMLPDSSIVWLNSGSTITYPQYFAQDVRRVKFSGEGYFEVVKNEKCPMEVVTPKGMKVTVLGTKFHICSYDDDSEESATLFSGKIHVSRVGNNSSNKAFRPHELQPKESMKFNRQGEAVHTDKEDVSKKIAWKYGELIFERTPMPEVIKRLERWHGVNITVKDSAVLQHHFTAEFGSASMVQILELLKFTSPIDYIIDNNNVVLFSRK